MPDIPQSTRINIPEVRNRSLAAREIVSALSDAMPTIPDLWFRINAALAETPTLISEIKRLVIELAKVRRDAANLVAAARATLHADRDAEPDPLYYLRDELHAQGHLPPEAGRR